MVLSTNSRVGYVGCFSTRPVSDVVTVPWRKSGFVCSGAAVTEWEWTASS